MPRGAALLLAATFLVARASRAQEAQDSGQASPRLTIELSRDSGGGLQAPLVRTRNLRIEGAFDGAMRNGFPVRFGFRMALWRDGTIYDRLVREVEWDAVVLLEPVSQTYQLVRSTGSVESLRDSRAVNDALATPFTVDLLPPAGSNGRYYYLVTLTIESLSLSELEEVERWLKGDLGRALTQRGDVGNAFSRGARLALIRLSGLPRRVLTARTDQFRP